MDMIKFFHMNGGFGNASNSSNSGLQRMGIMRTKGVIEQAISDLCHNNLNFPKILVMADLGCSSGPNTLLVGSIVINAVVESSLEMGLKPPKVQINLNDLPTNDFNTIFIALQELQRNTNDVHHQLTCFFTGVPGSFYGRLFPMKSLNFAHSSHSLHWLSKGPKLKEINKGNIYLSSTTPESVCRAYFEQFQNDFLGFLRCRSEEIIAGGQVVLTLAGRTTDDSHCEESYYLWKPFAKALQELVFEGLVEEEKLDAFNLPWYTACPTDIINLVTVEGSFTINQLEIFDVKWKAWNRKSHNNDAPEFKDTCDHGVVYDHVAKAIRAAIEPLVANHFGREIVDDVFMRYGKFLNTQKSKKEYEASVLITVSLTKKM